MNAMEMVTGIFGWALVHSLWQILVIAAAVKFILYLFRDGRSMLKYGIVLGGLTLMVLAFGITLYLAADRLPEAGGDLAGLPSRDAMAPAAGPGTPLPVAHESTDRFASMLLQARRAIDESTGYVMAAWFAGFLFFAFRFSGSFAYITRMKNKYSFMLPPHWQSRLGNIKKKLRVTKGVVLMESAAAAIPMVVGHLRPAIILPLGLATHIPFNQLEAILVHELAHIRRKDYLVNLVVSALEWVFFYHPFFWWLKRELDLYREHCCDDITIAYFGNPDPLRKALLDLSSYNQRSIHIAAALYKNDHQLLNRIKRMKTKNQKNHGTPFRPAPLLAVLAIIALGLAGSALAPHAGGQWQSMSLIPTGGQENQVISTQPEKVAIQVPDTTTDQKKTGTVKKINDDGVVSLELDEEGNLLGVSKDGRELTGEEREKYERLIQKVQELKEKEKTLEKNREELEKARERLKETELKMKEVQKEYQHAMQEYIEKQARTSWRAYDSAWGLYGEQQLKTGEYREMIEKMIEKQQDLAALYHDRYRMAPEAWIDVQDDLLRDRLADQYNRDQYQEQFEEQYRKSQEQLEKSMQQYEDQRRMQDDYLLRNEEIIEKLEYMKRTGMNAHAFEQTVRRELVSDGLLGRSSDRLSFKLTEKRLVVNGEKQNAQLRDKYLQLYQKYADEDLAGEKQVIIED